MSPAKFGAQARTGQKQLSWLGNLSFVEKVKSELGIKPLRKYRETYALRESGEEAYRVQYDVENESLNAKNTLPWKTIAEVAIT